MLRRTLPLQGEIRRRLARLEAALQLRDDLVVFGIPSHLVFREQDLPVHLDVEDTSGALHQQGIETELFLDLGRQPGGPRQVVSAHAVGDRDPHGVLPSMKMAHPSSVCRGRG